MKTVDNDTPKILIALVFAVAPYLMLIPTWIIGWCLLLWGYAFQTARSKWRTPKPWMRKILILIGLIGVLISFEWTLAGETFVGMLAIMVSLKPMEIQSYRDKMVTVFFAYFLILTNLLYNNSLSMALYMLGSVCITTAVLVAVNHHMGPLTAHLKLSALLMIQAIPLTVALFCIIPRPHGHLWGVLVKSSAQTGFSERLVPGDISNIAQNNEIAFRVDFENDIPAPDRLYWRGIVFWTYTGENWERGTGIPYRRLSIVDTETIRYTISLEPHAKRWWFALDLPVSPPRYARLFDDFTLRSRRRLTERMVYTLRSHSVYHTGPFKNWEVKARHLPSFGNPKARKLALKWSEQASTPEEIVAQALSFFNEYGFAYTLKPPPLSDNVIDDFLFRTRKGYCEHFASAFAFLMRAAGIPARIVGGYLGGEWNPFGNYLIVRQSDAHVWVEVWLPKTGWTRVDPTTAVAPQRVAQGSAAALPPAERPIYLSSPYLAPLYRYWKPVQFAWDRVNTGWNQWVVGYSTRRQKRLLSNVGIEGAQCKAITMSMLIILASIGCGAMLLILIQITPFPVKTDRVQRVYTLFCRKLARLDLPRSPDQGPIDYGRRIISKRKDLTANTQEIIGLYVRLRYGRGGNSSDLKRLHKIVKKFKPRKR